MRVHFKVDVMAGGCGHESECMKDHPVRLIIVTATAGDQRVSGDVADCLLYQMEDLALDLLGDLGVEWEEAHDVTCEVGAAMDAGRSVTVTV